MAGKYAVPPEIRDMRPEGTTVKAISGHYYVYEQDSVKGKDGKWRTRSGRCVGKIDPERGFVPNSSTARSQEWRTLEFGQWAVADDLSRNTYSLLREFFHVEDADRIYVAALCHFVEGLTYMKDVSGLYDMSVLSLRYPGLRLDPDTVSRLYDDLERRGGSVMKLQSELAEKCSDIVTIDGHVVGSSSKRGCLASRGYEEFPVTRESQVCLLTAFDAANGRPICSRTYEGCVTERFAVRDLLDLVSFSGTIFLIDHSLDKDDDADFITEGGNHYVFPLDSQDKRFAEAVLDLEPSNTFIWQRGDESRLVQYTEREIDGRRVVVYCDVLEQLRAQADLGVSKLAEQLPYTGAYVLQTSIPEAERDAQALFSLYEERLSVETYFDYFRCGSDGYDLSQRDYYYQQGLAFVMQVAGLIECDVREAVAASGLGMSVADVLMDARAVKADRMGDTWVINNCLNKREQRLAKLGVAMEARPTRKF
ncbi:MAG: hypothetical protein Q4B54_05150 [Coriobacteriales bacterium]|nr:hypothetical protein [Coriobacteriales bacterium]